MSRPTFRCFVIGSDTLLTECTGHLLEGGHDVLGVVTDAPRIAEWARARNLPVVDPAGMEDALSSEPFDHLFAITWLRLLPDQVLRLPRGRAINFHDGPLPGYAGLNVPAWGLLDGVSTWAVTWHEITAGVDTGDILLETPVPLADDETSLSLNMKCFAAARDGFPSLVADLAHGRLRPRPQASEGRRLFRRSDRPIDAGLLDWSRPARELEATVRALDFGPYPNPLARAKLLDAQGRPWLVTAARAEPGPAGAEPGTVLGADPDGWRVATGDGVLRVGGLADLRGRDVDPAVHRPFLADGHVLEWPDAAARTALDSAVRSAVPHEEAWRRRLSRLEPALLPGLEAASHDESASDPRCIPIALPPSFDDAVGARVEAAVCAAWSTVVARLGRRAAHDLAWFEADPAVDGPTARALFSSWRPLRATLEPGTPFRTVAIDLSAEVVALRERGSFPTELISRHPELAGGPAAAVEPLPIGFRVGGGEEPALPPVVLELDEEGNTLKLRFDEGRLSTASGEALAAALGTLLRHAAAEPDTPWNALPLVDGEERARILDRWNGTATPVRETLLHEGFEARVTAEPDRVAVRFGPRHLTYGELDRRAQAVAHRLREVGVGPGAVVGVLVERSPELLIATLGVLKAGGAYLPLDPDFPAERIAFMLEDAGVHQVVIHTRNPSPVPLDGLDLVDVAETGESERPLPGPAPTGVDLAYVIYTSGSTGRPKGVLVEHRNVANFFTGMDAVVRHEPPGVWMAVTSLSFDISVLELFWTLARGFEVVLFRDSTRDAGVRISTRLHERGMQFGLFMWGNDDGPGPEKYRLMLDAGRYFDDNGFDSVWTPERHFHAFGGPFPNPSVTGAALAAVTTNVSIRSGSCVSPLHHPIRVAEEWAVVDNLSDGRVGLAFAAGWQPNDFVLRPGSYPDQKQVMIEQIDVIRRLWRGEAVEFTNPLGDTVALTTLPRPVQDELPFWVTTAGNPDTYRLAGRMGANVLTHLLGQTLDEVADKIAAYREARAEAGLDPEDGTVTLMLHTFVGDDDEAVKERVREPMKDYLRASMKLVLGFAWTFPAFKRPGGPESSPEDVDLSSLSDEETEAILDFAFDRYYETSGLFGTVESCLDMVARCADIGVDEIACLLDFGVDTDAVLDGLPALKVLRDRANAVVEGREAPPERTDVADLLRQAGVSHLQCTPSMARLLLDRPDVGDALNGLEHVMVGGEAFPPSLSAELRSASVGRITNMYGPTETTIWSTTHEVDDDGPVPIGRPIANTRVYVLDPWGEPVPTGFPGDLWIGGAGVVRGYHDRPAQTAERFLTDPFATAGTDDVGPRMYHTGDLARWRRDGVLEFLGRVDHQVKVRGYRIEPGEIEALLEAMPDLGPAAVILREDTPGDQRLVAYVVADDSIDADAIRRALGETLPPYMVPAHVVGLDRLPLTPNGKIDRAALPAPGHATMRSGPAVAPTNELEATLVAAWTEVLGLAEVGIEDNFFDAGGHSLLVVQLHRILGERIAQPVSLVDLYRFPTIKALARHLSEAGPDREALDASAARGARRREMMRQRRGG